MFDFDSSFSEIKTSFAIIISMYSFTIYMYITPFLVIKIVVAFNTLEVQQDQPRNIYYAYISNP